MASNGKNLAVPGASVPPSDTSYATSVDFPAEDSRPAATADAFTDLTYIAAHLLGCGAAILSTPRPDPRIIAFVERDGWAGSAGSKADHISLLDATNAERRGLNFYCGVPMRSSVGQHLGQLTIVDVERHPVASDELDLLLRLSHIAATLLEAKKRGYEPYALLRPVPQN